MLYDLKEWLKEWCNYNLTSWTIWLIKIVNPYKDRMLSNRLHDLADWYDPRPTGEWSTPCRAEENGEI